jgi:hypothetical protein
MGYLVDGRYYGRVDRDIMFFLIGISLVGILGGWLGGVALILYYILIPLGSMGGFAAYYFRPTGEDKFWEGG